MRELLKKYNWEIYLFVGLLLMNALPLFVSSNFVTLDGGAHAYNTNIISELLFNKESIYHQYYEFNPEPVPNWFTHILLVIFKSVMPYFMAEKLVVLIYFILTPLFFRKTVLLINPNNKFLTYIILPFTHFLMLYLGFFNFCYGILFSFMGIYYWTKNLENMSLKKWGLMFLLLVATYFSHIFPFVVLVMYCLSSVFFNYLKEHGQTIKNLFSKLPGHFIKPALIFLVLLTPLLYLLKNYFAQRPTYGKEIFLTHGDLARLVMNIKPLQVYSDGELLYTKILCGWICLIAVLIAALIGFRYLKKQRSFRQDFVKHTFVFLSIVLLGLLFFVPDDDGYGGFISIRIILFIWYFIVFWIAVQEINKKVQLIFVIVLMGIQAPLMLKRIHGVRWVCSEYKKMQDFDKQIEPGSTVVQIYNNDANWLGHHFSNYLGTNKPIVVLDNYEASRGYFPIVWKDDYMPDIRIGNIPTTQTCIYWKSNPYNPEIRAVDYVLVIGEKPGDECYEKTKKLLSETATLVQKKENVELYRIKKKD